MSDKYKLIKPLTSNYFNTLEPPVILTEVKDLCNGSKVYSYIDRHGYECKVKLSNKRLEKLTEKIEECKKCDLGHIIDSQGKGATCSTCNGTGIKDTV